MSHDTWIHRGVRVLVRPLARTALTPNHVTAVRLATGLAASLLLALGGRGGEIAGAVLFLVSMICDRADGELARLTGRTSRAGHYFDLATDMCCNAAVLAGIGIGLRGDPALGALAPWLGALAGGCVATAFVLIIGVESRRGPGSVDWGERFGFDPDDAMVVVPIAVLAGGARPLLVAAAICAPIAMVAVAIALRRISAPAAETDEPEGGPEPVDAGTDAGEREERSQ